MKIKNLSLAVILMGAASFSFTSCIFDDNNIGSNTGKVIIEVNTDKAVDTKAGSKTTLFETTELNSDGVSLFLSGSESIYNENPFAANVATKGSIIIDGDDTHEGTALNSNGQQFFVSVLNNGSFYHTINNETAKSLVAKYDPNGAETKWPLLKQVDWPEANPKSLDFWAYYDANSNVAPSGNGYSSYKYTGPASGNDGMDASRTSDFLVAKTAGATQNNVALHFYHALSAIRFHVDHLDNGYLSNYKSLKVRISGIYSTGDVEYTGNASEMYFDWDFEDTMVPNAQYEQVLYDDSKKGQEGYDEFGVYQLSDRTFFIVPQLVGPTTDVLFTFYLEDVTGHVTIVSANNVGTTEWKPGYIYNYNIGQDTYGNVGVQVLEGENGNTFDGSSKENVRFELTKSSASYLRAKVVANWCLPNGKVYKTYTGGYTVTNNWVLGTDGFYYSKHPVLGHSESKDFISEFTPNVSEPTSAYDLHLEMKFLVQALSFDIKADVDGEHQEGRAEWAWGEPFKSMLADGTISKELE